MFYLTPLNLERWQAIKGVTGAVATITHCHSHQHDLFGGPLERSSLRYLGISPWKHTFDRMSELPAAAAVDVDASSQLHVMSDLDKPVVQYCEL